MNKDYLDLIVRYFLIFLVGLGNLFIFYKIFFTPTFQGSAYLLGFLGEVTLFTPLKLILFNETAINIIDACIAGSAYYLLFILVFSVRNIKFVKRFSILVFSFAIFLLFNIIRIVWMALIAGGEYFKEIHLFFWYFISIILVIGIWFLSVKLFKITSLPVYSDIKFLLKEIKHG